MANLSLAQIESSNLPASQKSAIRSFYDRLATPERRALMGRAKGHVVEGAHAIRQGGESAVVGGVLGAAHCYLQGGLDQKKIPLDAVAGVVGLVGGVALAHEGVGVDLRNAGASALTVFAFRKTYEVCAQKRAQSGKAPGGGMTKIAGEDDMGEDPIIAAARAL